MNQNAPNYFSSNRKNLHDLLPHHSVAIFFAATPQLRSGDTYFPYCQNKNFYYLTGYNHKGAVLVIHKTDQTSLNRLFVSQTTEKQAHWFGALPTMDDIRQITEIEKIFPIAELSDTLSRLLPMTDRLIVDYEPVSVNEPIPERIQFINAIRSHYPHLTISPVKPFMASLREIKQDWEIERIRNAIEITRLGILSIFHAAAPGMTEFELEAHFNFELNRHHISPAFPTILAGGENATVLHYSQNTDTLQDGDLVLLDLGAEYLHYSADISRTFPINGTFSNEQAMFYQVVLEANKKTIASVRPGLPITELNQVARNCLADGLLRIGYITTPGDIDHYFTHSVSHALGLDTHDVSLSASTVLVPGMVLTIEPGLYLPNEKIGIRIEDDILVTPDGHINLSQDIPKEIDEIERLVQKR